MLFRSMRARVFRAARRVRVVGTRACVDLFAAVTRGRLKPVLPVVRTEFHRIFFRARHEESPETISSTRTRDARPVRPLRRFQTFENGSSVCFQKLQEKRVLRTHEIRLLWRSPSRLALPSFRVKPTAVPSPPRGEPPSTQLPPTCKHIGGAIISANVFPCAALRL